MNPKTEDHIKNLQEAEKNLRSADHMIYVTLPLIKENKLIGNILEQIHKAIILLISAVLNYEIKFKNIEPSKSPKKNLENFKEVSEKYSITDSEIYSIEQLLFLMQKKKASTMEFVRKEKFVIMLENASYHPITIQHLKSYIMLAKSLLGKVRGVLVG